MVSRAIYDLDASKAPTEFQPLSLRCVLQSFLMFLLSYTINAWPNLALLPVGNLHRFGKSIAKAASRKVAPFIGPSVSYLNPI